MAMAGGGGICDHAMAAPAPADEAQFFRDLAARIEPSLEGDPARLELYVDFFRRALVNDPRLFAFQVTAKYDTQQDAVALRGYMELPETKRALRAFLEALGFAHVHDQIAMLPAEDLGAQPFAFVRVTHSLSFARPGDDQEVVTDCLLGEPLYLLRDAGAGTLLCHSGDGYVGYIRAADVRRVDAAEFVAYQDAAQVCITRDIETERIRLPVGARLKCTQWRATTVTVQLPSGGCLEIPTTACRRCADGPNHTVQMVIQAAQGLLGTRYLWGGKTSGGIDCSGLVQSAFAAQGIHLPRDSNQQIYLGRLTATRWQRDLLRAGDTLYFVGRYGKIRHTALYLGNGRYIEAAGGKVRISSMVPNTPGYDARRSGAFTFGKRLFD